MMALRGRIIDAMRNALLSLLALTLSSCSSVTYDLVIQGGRVMDPETGLDAVRNVGIQDGEIAVITADAISGKETLSAGGRVVAPGFIDLHQHGDSPEVYRAKIHDGVTSALELELGVEDVAAWYAEREGKTPLNFGATISHPDSRRLAMGGKLSKSRLSGDWAVEPMTAEQIEAMKQRLSDGLEQGAVGIGMLIAYTPGTTAEELDAVFRVAKAYNAAAYLHMRTNDADISNLEEVLAPARRHGTQLHIVHLNSSGRDRAPEVEPALLEHDGDLPAVRRGRKVQIEHVQFPKPVVTQMMGVLNFDGCPILRWVS